MDVASHSDHDRIVCYLQTLERTVRRKWLCAAGRPLNFTVRWRQRITRPKFLKPLDD
jgi:hypothetical protein